MSMHKIIRYESWSDARGDYEAEWEITFRFVAGQSARMYLRNGDPGYPATDHVVEYISVSPAADAGYEQRLAEECEECIDDLCAIALASKDAAVGGGLDRRNAH